MKKHSNGHKFLAGAAATAVIVSAVPAAGFAAEVNLTDVAGHWGEKAINYLVEKGAIEGYPDKSFKPDNQITRAEAAKVLAKSLKLTIDESAKTDFPDAADHWASSFIAAIQDQKPGVINGDNGQFRPEDSITRQEMSKMIVEAYKLELNEKADKDFTDNNSWGAEYVTVLASQGVVDGFGSEFKPEDKVTRAQTATFVHRAEVEEVRLDVEELTSGISGFITEGTTRIEGATVSIGSKIVTTNKEGYFELFVAPGTHEVTVAADGYETKTVSEVKIQADEMTSLTKDMGSLIDTSAIEVTGVIVDSETGSPLNAHVELEKHNEETDTWVPVAEVDAVGGTYTINQTVSVKNLELGAQYRQTVTLEGHKEYQQTITLDKEEVKNVLSGIELDAIETMNITGAVTDAEGNKVANATVTITDSEGNTVTEGTGSVTDGVYSLKGLKLVSGTYHMVIDDKKSAAYNQEITVTEGSDLVRDVSLEEGNTITATFGTEALNDVFGTDDAEEAKYTLELLNGNTVVNTIVVDPNEANLNFVMNRVAPGEYTLRVSGDYVITEEFTIIVDGDETFEQRVTPAGIIEGEVTGSTDATVNLLDTDKNIVATTTTENGTYSFTGIPAGKYTVEASQKGYVTKESEELTVGKNQKVTEELALEAVVTEGKVTGYVRLDGTLSPIANATVAYYDAEGDEIKKASVSNGAYSISSIEAGTYKVVVRGEGVETYTTTQTIAAGDDLTAVNYNLTAGGDASLKISVVDAEGEPVVITGSTAELLDANIDAVDPSENVLGSNLGVITDSTITFENLSAGSYDFKLDVLDNKYIDVETVATLAAGEEVELTIALTEVADTHNVNFRVIDENNENVENAYVVVYNEDGSIEYVIQTNAQGTQSLALIDGNYTLSVIQNGYSVSKQEITVAGNEVTVPVIQLIK